MTRQIVRTDASPTGELLEAYLRSAGWFIVRGEPDLATRLAHPRIVKVAWEAGGAKAAKTPLDLPASRAVVAAIGRVVGYRPIGNLWDGIEVYAGLVADLDW